MRILNKFVVVSIKGFVANNGLIFVVVNLISCPVFSCLCLDWGYSSSRFSFSSNKMRYKHPNCLICLNNYYLKEDHLFNYSLIYVTFKFSDVHRICMSQFIHNFWQENNNNWFYEGFKIVNYKNLGSFSHNHELWAL